MRKFTVPMKVKWTPFKRCEKCHKRKISTTHYHIHDSGLNSHIDIYHCDECKKNWNRCSNCDYILNQERIECEDCPYGKYGECGAFRCPTKEEMDLLDNHFKKKYGKK